MQNKFSYNWLLVGLIINLPSYVSAQMRLYNYITGPLEYITSDSLVKFRADASEPPLNQFKHYGDLYDKLPYDLEFSEPASNGVPYRFEIFRKNQHYQINSLKMPTFNLRRDTVIYYNSHSAVYQFRKKRWFIPLENPNYIGRNGKWLIFQDKTWTSVLLNSHSRRKKHIKKRFISSDLAAIEAKEGALFLIEKKRKTHLGPATQSVQVHTGYTQGYFQNGRIKFDRGQPFSCFVLNDTSLYVQLADGYKRIYTSSEPFKVDCFPMRLYPTDAFRSDNDYVPSLLSEGCFALKKEGKLGIIDTNGVLRTPFVLDSIEGDFQKSVLAVRISGKWGYINVKGQTVIPPQYDEARPFYDTLAAVKLGEKWGYINQEGTLMIPYQYAIANPFMFGTATVAKTLQEYRYRIDKSNETIKEIEVPYGVPSHD